MHLTPRELIDVVEGAHSDAADHLGVCDECRRELADLRAALSAAADVHVPEPSPLFWEQFSARVSQAVAVERVPAPWWQPALVRPRLVVPLAAVVLATLILLVNASRRETLPVPTVGRPSVPAAEQAAADHRLFDDDLDLENDPSLTLVAELTADMDVNAALDAGFVSRGSADHAVTHMNADELRALQRLLEDALERPGA